MLIAKRKVKRHYGLTTLPTDREVQSEIDMLAFKSKKGSIDDFDLQLFAAFTTGQHPIELA